MRACAHISAREHPTAAGTRSGSKSCQCGAGCAGDQPCRGLARRPSSRGRCKPITKSGRGGCANPDPAQWK
jgi:hypothetical protein